MDASFVKVRAEAGETEMEGGEGNEEEREPKEPGEIEEREQEKTDERESEETPEGEPEQTRPYFARLRELLRREAAVPRPGVDLVHLSMGMSSDFEVAIEEGATMVRVGTAIFGPRPPRAE